MVKISVVIVSHLNMSVLIDCLNSIYEFNDIGDHLEVIVVDNSPNTSIVDYLKLHYPKVKAISSENNGFGAGNNIGAKISNGDILLFLNPDTILIEPIFEFAIEKFNINPNLAIFGLKLLDADLNRNMSFFFLNYYGIISDILIKLCNKLDIFIFRQMFISGANMFFRKEDFIQSGMFDENIFMYSEEKDITKRIIKMNKKVTYYKEKSLVHLEGKTSSDNIKMLQIKINSLKYYCQKYGYNFNRRIKSDIFKLSLKVIISKCTKENTELYKDQLSILRENLK